jgi:hypothetical protein
MSSGQRRKRSYLSTGMRVTPEEEAEGRRAAAAAERLFGGRLLVARPAHDRTAAVADALETDLGGPGYDELLVLGPHSTTFFGRGEVIDALRDLFPGGWYGGALPDRGFWGCARPLGLSDFLAAYRPTSTAGPLSDPRQ